MISGPQINKVLRILGEILIQLSIGRIKSIKEEEVQKVPEIKVTKLYVSSKIGLRLRSSPNLESDENIIKTLPYSSELFLIQESDKWINVKVGDQKGWVSAFHVSEVNPIIKETSDIKEKVVIEESEFKIGVSNLAEDRNTKIVRKMINDEMGGGASGWELQCTEYVQYKIQKMGIRINWPIRSNRHGGRWGEIFRMYGLYRVLNYPKAGCSMSFTAGFKSPEAKYYGHVAFVEKVFSNESIEISEANWPSRGKYNERILSKWEWQEKWGGVFVDFS